MFSEVLSGEIRGKLVQGDCLKIMPHIPDKSIDMILCDLPYGTTACKWDTIIPFEPLWEQYKRIVKDHGAIVLTASQPFTSALIMSNIKWFKYCWVWKKERPTNPLLCKKRPPKYHEDIAVFYNKQAVFNPTMVKRKEENKRRNKPRDYVGEYIGGNLGYPGHTQSGLNDFVYHSDILEISMQRGLHPSQKPVKLFEYLIKTYTNENDIVLDNCIGSGTTAVAAENLDRRWIGIELDPGYVRLASERIDRNRMERASRLF